LSPTDPEPLPESVQALIRAERAQPGAPAAALERVAAVVEHQLSIQGLDLTPPGDSGSPSTHVDAARSFSSLARLGLARLPFVLVGFGAGVVSSPALRTMFSRPPPPAVHIPDAPEPPPEAAPEVVPPAQSPVALPETQHRDKPGGALKEARGPASPPDSIAVELRQVDRARGLVRSGEGAKALDLLSAEERLHPGSQLTEERELLRLQALIRLGRFDEARAAGETFGRAHPSSLLLPSVDAALRSLPR
jgi:hypothetical protein